MISYFHAYVNGFDECMLWDFFEIRVSWGNLLRKGSPKPLPNLFGLLSNIVCASFCFFRGFSWVCA